MKRTTMAQQLDTMIRIERRMINPGCPDAVDCPRLLRRLRSLLQMTAISRRQGKSQ